MSRSMLQAYCPPIAATTRFLDLSLRSFTAPPGSENVRWLVLEHPVKVSIAGIEQFSGTAEDNNGYRSRSPQRRQHCADVLALLATSFRLFTAPAKSEANLSDEGPGLWFARGISRKRSLGKVPSNLVRDVGAGRSASVSQRRSRCS